MAIYRLDTQGTLYDFLKMLTNILTDVDLDVQMNKLYPLPLRNSHKAKLGLVGVWLIGLIPTHTNCMVWLIIFFIIDKDGYMKYYWWMETRVKMNHAVITNNQIHIQ